jgi:putative addiction module component (TIGR02574 family)
MPTSVQTVAEEALKLSAEDREALVERLIASLEPSEPLHPAWREEIAKRVADMEAGRSRFVPADEAMARLTAHIHRRRPAA